jgi:FkbM family methyltransferase
MSVGQHLTRRDRAAPSVYHQRVVPADEPSGQPASLAAQARDAAYRTFATTVGRLPPGCGKKAAAGRLIRALPVDGPHVRRVRLSSGALVDLDISVPQFAVTYLTHEWEPALISFLLARLSTRDRFFDVGANVGLISLPVALGCGASVHSFEPAAENVARLHHNAALNHLSNLEVVPTALSEKPGSLTIGGANSMTRHVTADSGETVAATTIDAYVRRVGADPSAIKIDVEGHEESVLRGASETLGRCKPLVLCEMHGPTREDPVASLLASHRYTSHPLPPVGLQRARRNWVDTVKMRVFSPDRG